MGDNIPRDFHNLRACLVCHLIKHVELFEKKGCDNCEEFISLRHNRDMVQSCTTSNFSGMIALCQPDDSWVARWQRLSKLVRGMYAIDVSGKLPAGLQQELRSMGIEEAKAPKWSMQDKFRFTWFYCYWYLFVVDCCTFSKSCGLVYMHHPV